MLRLPKGDEWNNLPTTKEEALKRGLSRFLPEGGELMIIRRLNSASGRPPEVTKDSLRKQERGLGRRKENMIISTPADANEREYFRAVSAANAQGKDADHIVDIARSGNGIRWAIEQGRSSMDQYHENFKKAGIALGNQADNVQALDSHINQGVKNAENRQVDAGIKRAGQTEDSIFEPLKYIGKLARRLDGISLDVLMPTVDVPVISTPNGNNGNRTNGHKPNGKNGSKSNSTKRSRSNGGPSFDRSGTDFENGNTMYLDVVNDNPNSQDFGQQGTLPIRTI